MYNYIIQYIPMIGGANEKAGPEKQIEKEMVL